jgi:hypothetical protein
MHPGRWAAIGRRATNLSMPVKSCPGCTRRDLVTCDCMRAITPEAVMQVVQGWIEEKQPGRQI